MHQLTAKFIVLNVCWFALAVWAWCMGFIQAAIEADPAHIGIVIAVVFLMGLISTAARVIDVDRSITSSQKKVAWYAGEKARKAKSVRKMQIKNEHLADVVEGLVIIGLIGNAVGFFLAFRKVDSASLATADGVMASAANMLGGLGTAFGSTLIGCVLALWTIQNFRLLTTATALHLEEVSP